MNCAHCEERMSDYLEDALNTSERMELEAHLQVCIACNDLLQSVRTVMRWGKDLQEQTPPAWLSSRIAANTPLVVRITWRDWVVNVWKGVSEPRFALSLLTSIFMLGWMGQLAGFSAADVSMVRHPSAIYQRMEGWANRAYGDAVRGYYSSSVVRTIQCQISRIELLRENS
jgi:anti-sigma factor RsiW